MRISLFLMGSLLLLASCSTTRVLPDGQYKLESNTIKADNPRFNTSDLSSYIRQKPNGKILGMSPFVSIYNWAGTSDSAFARFLRKIGEAPVVYDPSQVDASIENMLRHLEYIGYYGSDIESEVKVKGRKVKVTYYVTLGKRFTISEIKFNLPEDETFREDFGKDLPNLSVKPGDFLAESALEDEASRSAQHFRNQGYFGMSGSYYSFEADTLSGTGTAALTMTIAEYMRNDAASAARPHRKFTIGRVDLSYPEDITLRPSMLENLITLRPGQLYGEENVNHTYARLASVPVLTGVNITMNPVSEDRVDCDIQLQHSGLQGFKTNLEASVNSTGLIGISPQLSYTHKNVFRGGELLNLALKGNFQFKPKESAVRSTEFSTSASIRFPRFLGLPNRVFKGSRLPHTDLNLGFSYQDRPEYRRTIISTSFGYTGNWGERFYYQLYPFQANVVRLFDISDDFIERLLSDLFMINAYSDHFDVGVGGSILYTTDASTLPKGSFHTYRFTFASSGNFISLFNRWLPIYQDEFWMDTPMHSIWNIPYSQYVKAEIQATRTIRLGRRERMAVAYRLLAGAGLGYGNSLALPFEQQFYVGGASSMRGWQARTLGPGNAELMDYFVIPSQTGDMRLEANLEWRFPLFWKVEGALFADAGNVWYMALGEGAYSDEFLTFKNLGESLGLDGGIGFRVNLDYLLARIDFGLRLHDPSREEGSRWIGAPWLRDGKGIGAIHFGIGYPF